MRHSHANRGGAPVGFLSELEALEAASILYLRRWCDGPRSRAQVSHDFAATLGAEHGQRALDAFENLYSLCCEHGRRPLMRHAVNCKCMGSDESCFANFVAAAATGAREDALMIATLLVRPDVAPILTALAADFGLALARMNLRATRSAAHATRQPAPRPITLH